MTADLEKMTRTYLSHVGQGSGLIGGLYSLENLWGVSHTLDAATTTTARSRRLV